MKFKVNPPNEITKKIINMRTFILSLFLCGTITLSAQTYNTQQEMLRTGISKYLYRQGYNPEEQSDGLKFKSEGDNYYIEIDPTEKSPMYLRMCRYVKYDDVVTRNKIWKKLNDCNSKYAIKVTCQDRAVVIAAELFPDVFDTLLDLIKSTYESVKE